MRSVFWRLGRLAIPVAALLACASTPPSLEFSEAPSPHGAEAFPNWPIPPDEAEKMMGVAPKVAAAVEMTGAGGGTTGALRVVIEHQETGAKVPFKFTSVNPRRPDGINNSPRKEGAAYEVQKLFLDPEDYVVPTTVVICVPVERYRRFRDASPTLDGSTCVLGSFSLWLQDITIPETLYDESRFLSDPAYAYFMANMNVFTYLFEHQDGRQGNFLVSKDERRQVFSIDNGVAMNRWPFYNFFVKNWYKIRVPALRRESIERLRQLRREDLDVLAVVDQLERDAGGVYRQAPHGPPLDPDEGIRIQNGTVQFGLKRREIDKIWERIEALLEAVDEGNIQLF